MDSVSADGRNQNCSESDHFDANSKDYSETASEAEFEFSQISIAPQPLSSAAEDTGALVAGKDVNQLYFVYVTNSREDWHYILHSKGLGAHCEVFDGTAPFDGSFVGTLDGKLEYSDAILRPSRTPSEGALYGDILIDQIEPEVLELEGIPAHLSLEQFVVALRGAVPDWSRFRHYVPAPRQDIALSAQLAMVADLLSASALPSTAGGLLNAMAASSSQTAVFASVEGGHVSAGAARGVWRRDGTIARVLPNKLPFRVLDVYNGPILVSCLEERSGHVVERERQGAAEGVASAFVKGCLFDTYSKEAILKAVASSTSYSNLLKACFPLVPSLTRVRQRLLHAGFDLAPSTGDDARLKHQGNARCWRIMQGPVVVGAMWDRRGLFGCLRWQPSPSDFGQSWGTVAVYREDSSPAYVECWSIYQRCRSTSEMRAELSRAGYRTKPVPYSAHSVH